MRPRPWTTLLRAALWLLAGIQALATMGLAHAHVNSFVSAQLRIRERRATLRLTFASPDLREALGTEGSPTERDVLARASRLRAYLSHRIRIRARPAPLHLVRQELAWQQGPGKGPAQVVVTWHLASRLLVERICVHYLLFFDLDPTHLAAWTVAWADTRADHLFSPDQPRAWCLRRLVPASERFLDRLSLTSSALAQWTTWAAVCLLGLALLAGPRRKRPGRFLFGLLVGAALGCGLAVLTPAGHGTILLLLAASGLTAGASRLLPKQSARAAAGFAASGLAGTALALSALAGLPAQGRDALGLAAAASTWTAAWAPLLLGWLASVSAARRGAVRGQRRANT